MPFLRVLIDLRHYIKILVTDGVKSLIDETSNRLSLVYKHIHTPNPQTVCTKKETRMSQRTSVKEITTNLSY